MNVFLGFAIVGPMIGLALVWMIYGDDVMTGMSTIKPEFREAYLVVQGATTFIGLIVLPAIHVKLLEKKSLKNYYTNDPQLLTLLGMVALVGLTFPAAMSPLTEWNVNLHLPEFLKGVESWAREMEDKNKQFTDVILGIQSPWQLIPTLIVVALLPAIGEELAFRGLIQQELWRATGKIHIAIWLSAFIFSAIHFEFFGFVPRLLLGALFGYLYYWTGNLLVPIFSHFFNNAFGVIMVYLHNIKVSSIDVESDDAVPLQFVIPCLIATALLLYVIQKRYASIPSEQKNPAKL